MTKTISCRVATVAVAAISTGSVLADVRLTNDYPGGGYVST
jgi:hypothetical protein